MGYVRLLVSLGLLALLALVIDPADVIRPLQRLPTWSLVTALVIAVPQVVLSALRWRYTAYRLGLPLGIAESILAYYRATLVNQILPGGVIGDIERAWRARHPLARASAAAHSVIIERLSGQLVLLLGIAVILGMAPPFALHPGSPGPVWLWGITALILLTVVTLRFPRLRACGSQLAADLHAALIRWPAPLIHIVLSVAVVASYFATLALLDTGIATQPLSPEKFALYACLLLSMVLPVSVAGWGVREGVAATLWPLAGFPASEGVALGIAYGLVILLSSLPGLIPVPGGTRRTA